MECMLKLKQQLKLLPDKLQQSRIQNQLTTPKSLSARGAMHNINSRNRRVQLKIVIPAVHDNKHPEKVSIKQN
jgi:hypothetical protein